MEPNIRWEQGRVAKLHGWLGSCLLLSIIPVKLARWLRFSDGSSFLIGIAPSLLGPAGLLFLLLSSKSGLTRLSLVHSSLLVLAIALGLEFAQLLPRPGILEKVQYAFDWYDVVASVFSVGAASVVALINTPKNPPHANAGQGRTSGG